MFIPTDDIKRLFAFQSFGSLICGEHVGVDVHPWSSCLLHPQHAPLEGQAKGLTQTCSTVVQTVSTQILLLRCTALATRMPAPLQHTAAADTSSTLQSYSSSIMQQAGHHPLHHSILAAIQAAAAVAVAGPSSCGPHQCGMLPTRQTWRACRELGLARCHSTHTTSGQAGATQQMRQHVPVCCLAPVCCVVCL